MDEDGREKAALDQAFAAARTRYHRAMEQHAVAMQGGNSEKIRRCESTLRVCEKQFELARLEIELYDMRYNLEYWTKERERYRRHKQNQGRWKEGGKHGDWLDKECRKWEDAVKELEGQREYVVVELQNLN